MTNISLNNYSEGYSSLDSIKLAFNSVTNAIGATNLETKHRIQDYLENKDKQKRNCPEELKKSDLALTILVDYAYNIPIDIDYYHPIIRITIVNLETGEYFETLERPYESKQAVFGQEEEWCRVQIKGTGQERQVLLGDMRQENDPTLVYPVLTNPVDLRLNRDKNPAFNEEFTFNLKVASLIEQKAVIFFELIDFNLDVLSKSNAAEDPEYDDDGFKLIAWSYVIANGESSFHLSDCKLQFYKYSFDKNYRIASKPKVPLVFYSFNWPVKTPLQSYLRVRLSSTAVSTVRKEDSAEPLCVFQEYDLSLEGPYRLLSWDHLLHTFCKDKDDGDKALVARQSLEASFDKLNQVKQIWNYDNLRPDSLYDRVLLNTEDYSGCYRVKFSNFGKYVALAFPSTAGENYVIVYNLFDKNVKYNTIAHQGIINDLKWSGDDEFLLTASSDQTVRVFRTFCGKSNTEIDHNLQVLNCYATLAHPSYVYGADFDPSKLFFTDKEVCIVTICNDGYIRFWKVTLGAAKETNNFSVKFEPKVAAKVSLHDIYFRDLNLREMFFSEFHIDENEAADKIYYMVQNILEEKMIYPNTLCFDSKKYLYVGDSYGVIHQFNCEDLDTIEKKAIFPSRKGDTHKFLYHSSFIDEEFVGDKITQISYLDNDPDDNKMADDCSMFLGHVLIVQSNDNAIRSVKVDQQNVMNKYVGIKAQKYNMRHCLSPDAKYLLSGSEDGRVMMWDVVTGIGEDTNYTLESNDPVLDVDWNHRLNMVAITQYGSSNSCLFYVAYNKIDINEPAGDVYQDAIVQYFSRKEQNQLRGINRKQKTNLDETLERGSNRSTPQREAIPSESRGGMGKKLKY